MKNLNQSVKEMSLLNDHLTKKKIEQDSFVSYSEYIDFGERLIKNCFIDTCDTKNLNILSKKVGLL